jgi:WD40 repeat protein/uncharacterized caspase-like protein
MSYRLFTLWLVLLSLPSTLLAQTQTPDKRGIGVQGPTTSSPSDNSSQVKEAKPELILQTGYSNLYGATRLVFSPDARLVATTTFRSSAIKLWETATGRELRTLSTGIQASAVMAPEIAFSRDGRYIAGAAGDNSVKVWEVMSGREVQTLTGSQGSIMVAVGTSFLGFTQQNHLVTVSDAARVWDLTTGKESLNVEVNMQGMAGYNGFGGGIALSLDGTQLALPPSDDREALHIIDLSSGKEIRRINLPDRDLDSLKLTFTPDGRLLAAAIDNKRLKLWDLSSKQVKELGPTVKEFSQIEFSRDGRLVGLSENYIARIWETATGRELTPIKAPTSGTLGNQSGVEALIGFSEDGKQLASGGFDTPTLLWDTETAKQVRKFAGRINMAYGVQFSSDGMSLYSGGRTRWDLRTGRGLRINSEPGIESKVFQSIDGMLVARSKSNSGIIQLTDAAGKLLSTLTPGGELRAVNGAHFSPDNNLLAAVYGASVAQPTQPDLTPVPVVVWDVKSGRQLYTLQMSESPLDAVFSADSKTIGTFGGTGQISLWDAATGSKLRDISTSPAAKLTNFGNLGNIRSVSALPNMADMSEMINNVLGTMSAGTFGQKVTSLAFSPNGKMVATSGLETKSNFDMAAMIAQAQSKPKKNQKRQDPQEIMRDIKVEAVGQVQVWDTSSGQALFDLKGHGKAVTKVAFSKDGKLIASASTDNTIRLWDIASRKELRTLSGHNATIESIDFSPDGRLLASASDDGGTFLWDTATGEHILSLVSLDDGAEWIVVTPQGLFDGTPVSWNQILWRYNQDTFNVAPIEWFFNEFYYPGLLAEVFSGKRPRVAQDVSKKDRRQPVVKVSLVGQPADANVATRSVKVKIDISDAPTDKENSKGSGAQDVRLFRNGSLVKVWHGDVLKGQANVSLEEEITVTAGPNRLVAYAFNRDNVKSKDAPLVFTGAESLKRKGTAYIIAVGVNEYANSQYNLKYAVADAQSFGEEMRARQTQLGGFEKVEVVTLLNENATKANVLATLRRLGGEVGPPSLKSGPLDGLKRVQPEDTVVIYYAGHGTAQSQRFYLIPHDLGYTGDRTKLTEQGLNSILSHSISDLELESAVEDLDAGHLLLIIDACNSGQALEAEEKRRGPMNSKGLAQLAYEKGMYILTAAQSFQAALEAAHLGHGYLTYALVEEGLKTSVADQEPKDGILFAREWLNFATDRVPQMQEQKMIQGRGVGLQISFTEGESGDQKRTVQRPRVFYRREMDTNPLVIAKPN